MSNPQTELLTVLNSIEGNGSFVTSGVNNFVFPDLHIVGVGDIGFPLNQIQIEAIIEVARQAPFGKGSRTLTDTSVRNTWEVDEEQLTFQNKDWQKFLKKVVKSVRKGLGIDNQTKVEASLYKLLIYEEGGFFLPHKDSEKQAGMFGTLIIGLPAAYTGGELQVRFDGREEIVDLSAAASHFSLPHVAFYADCEHEVKPVTSGFRVCLVYNLIQVGDKQTIRRPEFSRQIEQLEGMLTAMLPSFDYHPKVVLLGHQYTPANFTFRAGKIKRWAQRNWSNNCLAVYSSITTGKTAGTTSSITAQSPWH